MSDLNIIHAQNADVKNRVSHSDLACDSPASALARKDIEAFELAMRGEEKGFSLPNYGSGTTSSPSERKDINPFENGIREKGILQSSFGCDHPDNAPLAKQLEPHQLNMQEKERNVFNSLQKSAEHPNEPTQVKAESYRVLSEDEDKTSSSSFGRNDTPYLENGHTPLASLFSMASTFNEVDAPVRAEAPRAVLSEADLHMLVEHILVSAANDGRQEVRLILNERVLAGTEIILSRDLGGQLVVALHCTDTSTFQTLVASQFDLKQMLESSESSTVQVSVDIHQDGNDAERRSQGYLDYEPDQTQEKG